MRPALILPSLAVAVFLTGCGQILTALFPLAMVSAAPALTGQSLPTTPDAAIAQVEGINTQVTAVGDHVAESATGVADKLETFGDGVIHAGQYVGGKVEGLGNLVIEATGGGLR